MSYKTKISVVAIFQLTMSGGLYAMISLMLLFLPTKTDMQASGPLLILLC